MSTEANKALVRRYVEEVINQGNVAAIDDFNPPTYVNHLPGSPPLDVAGVKQFVTMVRTAFPDMHQTIEDLIAEGDKVVQRATLRGTHQGEFQGIPPTGKPVSVTLMNISRIADDKIVEDWVNFDQLGMLQQLGVIPQPG